MKIFILMIFICVSKAQNSCESGFCDCETGDVVTCASISYFPRFLSTGWINVLILTDSPLWSLSGIESYNFYSLQHLMLRNCPSIICEELERVQTIKPWLIITSSLNCDMTSVEFTTTRHAHVVTTTDSSVEISSPQLSTSDVTPSSTSDVTPTSIADLTTSSSTSSAIVSAADGAPYAATEASRSDDDDSSTLLIASLTVVGAAITVAVVGIVGWWSYAKYKRNQVRDLTPVLELDDLNPVYRPTTYVNRAFQAEVLESISQI